MPLSIFHLGSVLELKLQKLFCSGSQCRKALTESLGLLLAKGRRSPGSYMFRAGAQGTGWSGHGMWAPPTCGEHIHPGSAQAPWGGSDPRPVPGTCPHSGARRRGLERSLGGSMGSRVQEQQGAQGRGPAAAPSERQEGRQTPPMRQGGPSDCQCLQGPKRHQDQLVRDARRQVLA